MSEWQPIETIPKDGKRYIVTDGNEVDIARSLLDEKIHTYTYSIKPTQWMALPSPPNEEQEGEYIGDPTIKRAMKLRLEYNTRMSKILFNE